MIVLPPAVPGTPPVRNTGEAADRSYRELWTSLLVLSLQLIVPRQGLLQQGAEKLKQKSTGYREMMTSEVSHRGPT